jgi:hypothetical protein
LGRGLHAEEAKFAMGDERPQYRLQTIISNSKHEYPYSIARRSLFLHRSHHELGLHIHPRLLKKKRFVGI